MSTSEDFSDYKGVFKMHSPECCLDEDEFEEKIRLSKDARVKMLGKGHKELQEEAADPIGEADKTGKRKYLEADMMWLRAARMDHTAIFYLEDRAKTCYKLRLQLPTHNSVLNCYKDEFRKPLDCECDVRKYLRDVIQEKRELAAEVSKHYKPEKKEGDKEDKKPKK